MLVEELLGKVMCVWGRLILSEGVLTIVCGWCLWWVLKALYLEKCIFIDKLSIIWKSELTDKM